MTYTTKRLPRTGGQGGNTIYVVEANSVPLPLRISYSGVFRLIEQGRDGVWRWFRGFQPIVYPRLSLAVRALVFWCECGLPPISAAERSRTAFSMDNIGVVLRDFPDESLRLWLLNQLHKGPVVLQTVSL